jgi:hypothetical protein
MTQKITTLQEVVYEQKRQITNELKTSTESLKINIIDLKFNIIFYQYSHERILQILKKPEPNTISLSCLSISSNSYIPENFLNYADSYWFSNNQSLQLSYINSLIFEN